MELNRNTRLEDLIREYPFLKTGMADINGKFKMLQTPMGRAMLKKATIAEVGERAGMPADELIAAIAERTGLAPASGKMPAATGEAGATSTAAARSEKAGAPEGALDQLLAEATKDGPATPDVAWWDKTPDFKTVDVRGAKGNFFPSLKKLAEQTAVGSGIEVVQTFEPIPLYDVMDELGYERVTVKVADGEHHVYFYRARAGEESGSIAFRPIALLNFPLVDEELGSVAVNFWNLTWNDEKRYLDQGTRLLLSMANALGAGRMRQATRELVKAYVHGVDSRAFDDVFELIAWNQGVGTFASEIGPSTLFRAYTAIKDREKQGASRDEIKEMLLADFGEKNPDVGVK